MDIRSPLPAWSDADIGEIKSAVLAKLALSVGKDPSTATDRDWFVATALAVRDRVMHLWLASDPESHAKSQKRVYYLSLEFLIGRLLADILGNLGLAKLFYAALGDLGSTSMRSERPSRMPRWGMAVLGGSRPASWRVIDTNGAGDIFHGAYVYSHLRDPDSPWERHFKFARAASAHAIQHLGNEASLPTLSQTNEAQARFAERRQSAAVLGLVSSR